MHSGKTKITVVGAGAIGSAVLFTLMLKQLGDELVLINRNQEKARAKASDIYHCTGFSGGPGIVSGDFKDSFGSDIVILTAGVLPESDGTRTDVLAKNIAIYKEMIPEIIKYSPDCVLIVLTNPVDVMAYAAMKISGLEQGRVIGTGTLLDTIRLKRILADETGVSPDCLDVMVIGEHGDYQIPLWFGIRLGGASMLDIANKTKRAGWDIRDAKEHSCYAIAYSTVIIVEAMLGRTDSLLPVSVFMKGQYGIENMYLSLPVKLGRKGVERIFEPELNEVELSMLKHSADILVVFFEQADKYINYEEKGTENEVQGSK